MYRLQKDLERLQDFRLTEGTLFHKTTVDRLMALAKSYRQSVTLYYNRDGYCLQASQGDEEVARRHLRHRTSNRLSWVRAIRCLPPHESAPRGRDEIEMASSCLDCMAIVQSDGRAVLLLPQVKDGGPTGQVNEVFYGDYAELCQQSLTDLLSPIEAQLGHHEKQERKNARAKRALLLGVEFTRKAYQDKGGTFLDELARLAETAGLVPAKRVRQKLSTPKPGTFIGKGKVEQLRSLVLDEGLDVVLFGCDLPYSTLSRLSELIGVKVIDRSELILDIFAQHAKTNEGRLQVKLARLDHELHRLLKEEKDLDRQAGGIGVRGGPGETAATLVKRRIHRKKLNLENELQILARQRIEGRRRRAKSAHLRVALAGYTNAGKSTLLNALVGCEAAKARDQLFTTLTTTTRRLILPSERKILLSDTVGFVENLPHHLVAAFESTLAASADADLTLVLIEGCEQSLHRHRKTVNEVLDKLGSKAVNRLPVLSKMDLLDEEQRQRVRNLCGGAVEISAKTGEGLAELLDIVDALLGREESELELLVPFEQMAVVNELYASGRVLKDLWTEKGVRLRTRLPKESLAEVKQFVIKK